MCADHSPPLARWAVLGDFSAPRDAQRAADALHHRGYVVVVRASRSARHTAATEGFAAVHVERLAWLGLAIGSVAGLILGSAVWSLQLIVPALAPALAAGRTAVLVLPAGTLAAVGWLLGALVPLALAGATTEVIVQPPPSAENIRDEVSDVESCLVQLGAWRTRRLATSGPDSSG